MSACGEMQPSVGGGFYGDLEEYLGEVERRAHEGTTADADDVYAQLAQREKDLVLAAELGKALLEKNEEISRANERLAEEYSHQLEVLEQEKHALRRKLDVLESECEGRVAELQADLGQLRQETALRSAVHDAAGAEKARLLTELTEQNHRLTAELKQASRTEDQLQSQLQALREQFNVRRSNLHDHVSQLEGLREEITLLSERKSELERRISALSDEREGLNLSLEESGDRILLLERRNREQEQQLRVQQRDIEELRQTNSHLQNRLDVVLRRCGTPISGDRPSLYNEIEMSSQSSAGEDEPSQCGQNKVPSHPGSSISFGGDYPEDEIECDDSEIALAMETEDSWKFREELVPIYRQLRRLCEELRRRRREAFSSADSGISHSPDEQIRTSEMRLGIMTDVVRDLANLVEEALLQEDSGVCMSCQSVVEERDALEKVQKELAEKSEELKRKSEDVSQLIAKLTLQETELNALREGRDQLKTDMDNSTLAKDQVVKKAWEVRDQAVARKNAVEIELARTRIDVMHINSQLMEAVQQKVELSQQLEQWKMDMEVLLDNQVMKKLKTQEQEDKKPKTPAQPTPENNTPNKPKRQNSRLFRLWR